jgi:hypothetical protein
MVVTTELFSVMLCQTSSSLHSMDAEHVGILTYHMRDVVCDLRLLQDVILHMYINDFEH